MNVWQGTKDRSCQSWPSTGFRWTELKPYHLQEESLWAGALGFHHITVYSGLTLLSLSLAVAGAMLQVTSPATSKHTSRSQSPHGSFFLGVQTLPSCSGKFPTSFKAQGLHLLPRVSLEPLPDLTSMTPQPILQLLGLGIHVQKPSIAIPHCQAM